jgi:hypothetical protein
MATTTRNGHPTDNVEVNVEATPEDALEMEMLLEKYSFVESDPLHIK